MGGDQSSENLYVDLGDKTGLRRIKNIGMVFEKLYRNKLNCFRFTER